MNGFHFPVFWGFDGFGQAGVYFINATLEIVTREKTIIALDVEVELIYLVALGFEVRSERWQSQVGLARVPLRWENQGRFHLEVPSRQVVGVRWETPVFSYKSRIYEGI